MWQLVLKQVEPCISLQAECIGGFVEMHNPNLSISVPVEHQLNGLLKLHATMVIDTPGVQPNVFAMELHLHHIAELNQLDTASTVIPLFL